MNDRQHVMAVVEYDGIDYHGFQIQANVPTVQETLERALAEITQEHIQIRYAGRTDTGVHALGQVIDFWTAWDWSLNELHRALNAMLPANIAVRGLRLVPANFHARFSALSRVYRYCIWNHLIRSPLRRRTHGHIPQPLVVDRMVQAAQVLVGTHDFRAFGAPTWGEGSTVRTVSRVDVWRDGDEVLVEIEANAFLRRMARRMVAGLIVVGQGRLTTDELAAILASGDPSRLKGSVPPEGLYLMEVKYGEL